MTVPIEISYFERSMSNRQTCIILTSRNITKCKFQIQFDNFQILLGRKELKRLSWLAVVTNELFLIAEFLISICLIATVAAEKYFQETGI